MLVFLSESTLSKGYRILIELGELVPVGAYGPNSIKDWKVLEIAFSYMGYQSLDVLRKTFSGVKYI
jgi:hypothetical protein